MSCKFQGMMMNSMNALTIMWYRVTVFSDVFFLYWKIRNSLEMHQSLEVILSPLKCRPRWGGGWVDFFCSFTSGWMWRWKLVNRYRLVMLVDNQVTIVGQGWVKSDKNHKQTSKRTSKWRQPHRSGISSVCLGLRRSHHAAEIHQTDEIHLDRMFFLSSLKHTFIAEDSM